ncbi:MAG: ribonuclease D [Kineosporiaceae bacterium]
MTGGRTEIDPGPLPLLTRPSGGDPRVVDTQEVLDAALAGLARADGPIAVDAERASGYRYGNQAYLVQLRRGDLAPILVDPVAGLDLGGLRAVLSGPEWVLHAASQDLPCLAELDLRPARLFDTELGGRLAGLPRVGLAAMTEQLLGVRLAKEHSAADWSTRPLPEPWLRYAALDVELLVDLRDALAGLLDTQGKLEWAAEEFAAVATAPPPAPRAEPWRRLGGLHSLRDRRSLAAARSLWQARDAMARRRDLAPGRILPDTAIVDAASRMPRTAAELSSLRVFSGPANRRLATTWLAALDEARRLPEADLPSPSAPAEGPPPPRSWPDRDPEAAGRLARVRPALADLAAHHGLPVENLLTPDVARRLAWRPPESVTPETVARFLTDHGARPWQVRVTAAPLTGALAGA